MIIIDENVEVKLAQTLKYLSHHPTEMGAIALHFSGKDTDTLLLQEKICSVVQIELDDAQVHLYFCEEGEVFILSSLLHARRAHKLAQTIMQVCEVSLLACDYHFYDLFKESSRLLAFIETRIQQKEQTRKAVLAQKREQAESARIQAKRHFILSAKISDELKHTLETRRAERRSLEVMMIEDDAFSRRLVGNILAKEYHLTSLENAETALQSYAQIAPDILFLDINLPNVTGHELLEKILLLDPQAYIIMLSGNSDKENVLQAMQRGARGFVAKPFTPDKLYQYIERCPTLNDRKNHAGM